MAKKKKVVIITEPTIIETESHSSNILKKRVAAYCRVSSNHIEQKSSYLAQVDEFTKTIKSTKGWEFAGIYGDEGKSGVGSEERLGFNQMIKDSKDGKIDLILTKSISRFARNVEISVKIVRELKKYGVEVRFEKENISSFDGKSEMIFTILASVAQEESRNISENTTWGIRKRMKDGKEIVNCKRFLGYDKNEDGNLVINEEEAEVVRFIYDSYLKGFGYSKIAKMLESKGYKTGAGETKWHGSTVSGILGNEKYYGHLTLQKTVTIDYKTGKRVVNNNKSPRYDIEDNHDPIISKEKWLAVQKLKEEKFQIYSGNNKDRNKYVTRYAFSGKLICNHCGDTLKRRHWNVGTPSQRIVWQCNGYIRGGKRTCDTKAVGDTTIKMAFVDLYNELITNKGNFFDTFIKTIEGVVKKSPQKTDYKQLEKSLKKLEGDISELIQMKVRKEIAIEDFNREYALYNEYRDRLLESKKSFINEQITESDIKGKNEMIKKMIYSNSNPITEFSENLFIDLVEKVMVEDPVTFTFVLKNSMEIPVNASKYHDGRKYLNKKF